VLFLVELAITAVVIGILSFVLVVQLTLVPGAILGEIDSVLTTFLSWGLTGFIEVVSALVLFVVTGLVVGIAGLPIRLIPPLRRLWLGNGEATIGGVVLGVLLILVSYVPLGAWESVAFENGTYPVYTPSPWPLLVGWFLLAFSLSLLVWPARWLPRRARAWWTETQLTKPVR
jgi:hypothetical protein